MNRSKSSSSSITHQDLLSTIIFLRRTVVRGHAEEDELVRLIELFERIVSKKV
jgi:hypothetical protein